jgi:pyruvate/2-oxoglutarate dehydrogenase complex dihydrolipoamide dehydrogenase (E3) component
MSGPSRLVVPPDDDANRALVERVHPTDWVNPEPAPFYHLVAVGGGTAGLVSAAGGAGLGARVALVERHLLGGDCLNVGCVPSKAVLRAARAVAEVRRAGDFGVRVPEGVTVDFAALMARMRRLRADLSENDSAQRFRGLGVDVFLGDAQFTGPDTLEVGGKVLRFRRAVLATGARAAVPALPGLAEAGFLTNETIFDLTVLPRRLAVLGAGPIGVELAQAFARFGSEVHLVGATPTMLPRDDPRAGAVLAAALQRDGVQLHLGSPVVRVGVSGEERILYRDKGEPVRADALLLAAGRKANVEGLNLEAARVAYGPQGVQVDERLRTSNPRIYAAGDVCSRYQFTHMADAQARLVLQNALFWGRGRVSDLVVPWCTCTDPEVAHVGLTAREAGEQGIRIDTLTQELSYVDRAVLDGSSAGFLEVHLRQGTDRIVGATLVASHAGDILATLALAMKTGQGLKTLARTILPYPTQAEALRKIADAWNRRRLTPFVRRLFAWRFRWWN